MSCVSYVASGIFALGIVLWFWWERGISTGCGVRSVFRGMERYLLRIVEWVLRGWMVDGFGVTRSRCYVLAESGSENGPTCALSDVANCLVCWLKYRAQTVGGDQVSSCTR